MKMLKRSLALLLAVAVLGGLFIGSISATGKNPYDADKADKVIPAYTDVLASHKNADAIYMLTAMNVLSGYTDGTYKPEGTITRAEFAVFVYRMMGYGEADKAYFAAKTSAFKDVAEGHWAEAFINACADSGLFVGYTDGTFKPETNISKAEVITVVLRCLGYDSRLPGNWPSNYVSKAVNIGLISLNGFIDNQYATRGEVAEYCADALRFFLVQYIGKEALPVAMGAVDRDGYAYVNNRTNEGFKYTIGGPSVTIELMEKMGYDMVDYNSPTLKVGSDGNLQETLAWRVDNVKDGQLYILNETASGLEYMDLASKYYVAGGDVTKLGNTIDAFAVYTLNKNEVVFVSSGTPYTYKNAAGKTVGYSVGDGTPFYVAVKADDKSVVLDASVNGGGTIDAAKFVFYDYSKNVFINSADVKPGDIIYDAGGLDAANGLCLVIHPEEGNFTEFDDEPTTYVVVNGKKYLTDGNTIATAINSFYDFGEGFKAFKDMPYDAQHNNLIGGDSTTDEFGKVSFAVALTGRLAYIGREIENVTAPDTYGIVTDFTFVDKGWIYDPNANGGTGGYIWLKLINGVTITLSDLTTKNITFNKDTKINGTVMPVFELDNPAALPFTYGDLITANGNQIFTEAANTADKLYGFEYAIMDNTKFDTVKKIGNRIDVTWGTNNDAKGFIGYTGTHEVYSLNDASFGFYVSKDKAGKIKVEILDKAKLAANAQYNQFEMFKFYTSDKTGLAVAYITGKAGEAPSEAGTFQFGFTSNVFKTADGWRFTIDGKNIEVDKNAKLYGYDGVEGLVSADTLVLYNLKDGKINELHVIADALLQKLIKTDAAVGFGDYSAELKAFGLGEDKFNVATDNKNFIFTDEIDTISLSGDPRISLKGTLIQPNTVFIDGAKIFDLTSGKVEEIDDINELMGFNDNTKYTFAFIGNESNNQIYYIIIVAK